MTGPSETLLLPNGERPQRVIRVPVWTVMVMVATMVLSPILSFYASVQIAERNSERIVIEREKAEEAARVESRRIACAFFGSSLDVLKENPPGTEAGKAQQANYVELYRISGCMPPRSN